MLDPQQEKQKSATLFYQLFFLHSAKLACRVDTYIPYKCVHRRIDKHVCPSICIVILYVCMCVAAERKRKEKKKKGDGQRNDVSHFEFIFPPSHLKSPAFHWCCCFCFSILFPSIVHVYGTCTQFPIKLERAVAESVYTVYKLLFYSLR